MNLIISQCLESNQDNDIQVEITFTELFSNNKPILKANIKESTIEQFINFLVNQKKHSKYVDILRAICIADGEPMIKN